MSYTHIIFDLDGTLIDAETAVLKTWQLTLQEYTGQFFSLEKLKVVLGIITEAALRKLQIEVGEDFEKR